MAGKDIRIIDLQVENTKIQWSVFKGSIDGTMELAYIRNEVAELDLENREPTIELLITLLELLTDLLRERRDHMPDDISDIYNDLIKVLGENLYGVLFTKELDKTLRDLLEDVEVTLLRIQLEFRGDLGNKLSSWPWEYLHCPDLEGRQQHGFLAVETQLMLNRMLYLRLNEPKELEVHEPMRILLIVSSPKGLEVKGDFVRERIEELQKKIKTKIKLDKDLIEGPIELSPEYEPKASWEKFKEKVRDFKPHIIHFIGHGQRNIKERGGMIAFVKEAGEADWRSDREFAAAVTARNPNLKLVFLQACESALPDPYIGVSGVAKCVANKGIPAVVGMQYKVEKEVADAFAASFYKALFEGKPVDVAVKEGREKIKELRDMENLAFGLPVLYLRSYKGLISKKEMPQEGSQRSSIVTAAGGQDRPERPGKCPSCGSNVPQEADWCIICGLPLICQDQKCRAPLLNPVEANFCQKCGGRIDKKKWMPKDGFG
jgi:hypothetical protein